jgi:hypothetical protein
MGELSDRAVSGSGTKELKVKSNYRFTSRVAVVALFVALTMSVSALGAPPASKGKVLVGLGEAINLTAGESNSLAKLVEMEVRSHGYSVEAVVVSGMNDDALRKHLSDKQGKTLIVIDATRIGTRVIVLVRSTSGATFRTDSLRLKRFNDVPIAAKRLVKAIMTGTPYDETATTNSLTGDETRRHERKFGEFLWGFGFNVGSSLTMDTGLEYGTSLRFGYEMENLRLDMDFAFVWNSRQKGDETFTFDWSLGAAYLFGDGNIAPFLMGGLGISVQRVERDYNENPDSWGNEDLSGSGVGFYLGAGVELLRFYSTRVIIDARVVLPTYKLEGYDVASQWAPSFRTNISILF